MKCEKCKKNEATVHLVTTINGVSKEEHLCSQCAEQKDISFGNLVHDMFGESSLFSSMLNDDFVSGFLPCDCGTNFFDIVNTGNVGCNNCNTHYKGLIADAMKNISIGAENEKKRQESLTEKDKKIMELRQKLSDAVEREDYETASKLKKEIDKLNS